MSNENSFNGITGLFIKKGLLGEELQAIKELETRCNRYEGLKMKLYWYELNGRSEDKANDFLYFDNGNLVGYLGLYIFNRLEAEISGMVHPDYRGKGISGMLTQAAVDECSERKITKLLFICENKSIAGKTFIDKLEPRYSFSDHKMEYSIGSSLYEEWKSSGIKLRRATIEDADVHSHVNNICFHIPVEDAKKCYRDSLHESEIYMYIAEIDGKLIGKIDVAIEEKDTFIYLFGVLPEYRNIGYGREILALLLQMVAGENYEKVILEVASDNPNAMNLYKSFGFRETTVYDYYEIQIPLKP